MKAKIYEAVDCCRKIVCCGLHQGANGHVMTVEPLMSCFMDELKTLRGVHLKWTRVTRINRSLFVLTLRE